MQTIYPYLLYDDAAAAIDFLTRAFGFEQTMRMDDGDRVRHAQLALGHAEIMLGQPERPVDGTAMLYVYVDRIDEHFARARDAGAEIVDEPEDQDYGDRRFSARDPQGHHWYFAERRDA
jgi:uncharacterized glyoxalase superfamily protein PhnB